MAKENNRTIPIALVTDLLAEMTLRATIAERKQEEAERASHEWYEYFKQKEKALEEANDRIKELEKDYRRMIDLVEDIAITKSKECVHNG